MLNALIKDEGIREKSRPLSRLSSWVCILAPIEISDFNNGIKLNKIEISENS